MDQTDNHHSSPNRLLDELIRYVRDRVPSNEERMIDDERIIRAFVRQLRRHPLPASLLATSIIWLLLADDEDPEADSPLGRQIEDEVVRQVKEGFDYTGARLKETSDRYPWLMSGLLVAGGLAAAFLLPSERKRETETEFERTDAKFDPGPSI